MLAQARVELVQGEVFSFGAKGSGGRARGKTRQLARAGCGAWPARWPRRCTLWAGSREAGEGDGGSGSLVNNPKFKTQFCNLIFSPSSLPQMKKC